MSNPALHLIHNLPKHDQVDWVTTSDILPSLERKFGSNLIIDRIPPGLIDRELMADAIEGKTDQRLLVLVCLPPA